ncbi:hypothetical protein GW17_00036945 [Ensete ventricosum]|nr:hypothetical protein GW17_00036945 [Ensete ventricosum]
MVVNGDTIPTQLSSDSFVALHLCRHSIIAESKFAAKVITEILHMSKDLKMCSCVTPGILDALIVALHLLSPLVIQHITAALYNLLSIKMYRSIIAPKKPLIVVLVDLPNTPGMLTRSIKDALKALFGLAIYPLNYIAIVELGIVSPLFTLWRRTSGGEGCKGFVATC